MRLLESLVYNLTEFFLASIAFECASRLADQVSTLTSPVRKLVSIPRRQSTGSRLRRALWDDANHTEPGERVMSDASMESEQFLKSLRPPRIVDSLGANS